jgi:hypothetical protein
MYVLQEFGGRGNQERVLGGEARSLRERGKKFSQIRLAAFSEAVFAGIVQSEGDVVTGGAHGYGSLESLSLLKRKRREEAVDFLPSESFKSLLQWRLFRSRARIQYFAHCRC